MGCGGTLCFVFLRKGKTVSFDSTVVSYAFEFPGFFEDGRLLLLLLASSLSWSDWVENPSDKIRSRDSHTGNDKELETFGRRVVKHRGKRNQS